MLNLVDGMVLYHGSYCEISSPDLDKCAPYKDFGKGFYLTENIELAKEWAVCRPDESNGWVHKYELSTDGLKILDFLYNVLENTFIITPSNSC